LRFYSESESHSRDSQYAGESQSFGPAGLYEERNGGQTLTISLALSGLEQPASLAATICHELGHVHLLADGRISRDQDDCEPLTDLLTVYFGAGILTANVAFQFHQWRSHSHQGWNARRQGYLSEAQFGYALACYSWLRGDLEAAWRRHLRQNIAYYFDDSMHFLSTTRNVMLRFGTE
jgi:hypothetical protein